jgi:hypothetical protein
MARTSYVWRDGELYERGTEPRGVPAQRSDLPCPSIRADGMDAIQSMADGQMYDGRSAYYDSVKRAGCEIVGDDRDGFGRTKTVDDLIPGNIGGDIKQVIKELSDG